MDTDSFCCFVYNLQHFRDLLQWLKHLGQADVVASISLDMALDVHSYVRQRCSQETEGLFGHVAMSLQLMFTTTHGARVSSLRFSSFIAPCFGQLMHGI